MTNQLDAALSYAERGWPVFALRFQKDEKGKWKPHPTTNKRTNGQRWGATTNFEEIHRRWQSPDLGIGIACGHQSGLLVVDVDTEAGHKFDGSATLAALEAQYGPLPDTVEARTPSGGRHLYFKHPLNRGVKCGTSVIGPGIDHRGEGGFVVAPPSIRPDGPYSWVRSPIDCEIADAPAWLIDLMAPQESSAPRTAPQGDFGTHDSQVIDNESPESSAWAEAALQAELAELRATPEGRRNDRLNQAAFNLGQIIAGGGLDRFRVEAELRATAAAIGLDASEIGPTIKSGFEAGAKSPRDQDTRKIAAPARDFDALKEAATACEPDDLDEMEKIVAECAFLKPMRRDAIFRAVKEATGFPLGIMRKQHANDNPAPPEPDHLVLARMTLTEIGPENIICADNQIWQWFDTGVWKLQDDRALKQTTQGVIEQEADDVDVFAGRVNGTVDVLKSEIFKTNHQFNLGDPETVNCLNGELTLDGLKPHCREHYRTTQIPVAYDPDADAPMFRAFLDQVFRDDDDRADKKQALLELLGYSLMSHARHEKFVMLIGPGANGKSVLLGVVEGLLGSANVAGVQPSNFDNRFQRAHLHQKLANIVTELRQGEVIADGELKAITSGEPATVEHKFQNPFVMHPFATCWFGTNHMPHTRDFSEALFRRATILQFNRTFAPDEQDPILKTKLLSELPGILNMALAAYSEATSKGFTAPQSSIEAKQEWKLEADQVAQFVDDACKVNPSGEVPMATLYRGYELWADAVGISRKVTMKTLKDRLTKLGFGGRRTNSARYVTGLTLERLGGDAW